MRKTRIEGVRDHEDACIPEILPRSLQLACTVQHHHGNLGAELQFSLRSLSILLPRLPTRRLDYPIHPPHRAPTISSGEYIRNTVNYYRERPTELAHWTNQTQDSVKVINWQWRISWYPSWASSCKEGPELVLHVLMLD